jgi:transcriptional regulator with XRE-family HTH domain
VEYEIWCRRLRQYRESLELTQEDVAFGIGISRSHYSSIEHGKTIINYAHEYNLAKYLGLTMEELIGFPMLRRKSRRKKTKKKK